ncbi:MAG: ABC transporter permease, partial [Verrucomicrobiota bacterium]
KDMMSLDNLKGKLEELSNTTSDSTDTQNSDTEEKEESFSDLLSQIVDIQDEQVVGKEVKNPQVTRMVGGYAIMFLLFAVNASASSLFEEKKAGMFHRLLSMPLQRTHILWSKYLYNMLFGLVQILVLFFGSSLLFEVDIYTNFLNLLIVVIFASAACTAFGMLLAAVSKTPQQAQGLGTVVIIVMSSVGGAWFPVSIMPEFIQYFSKITIIYWSVESLTETLWANASLVQLAPKLGILFLITATVNAFSLWRFKNGDLFH